MSIIKKHFFQGQAIFGNLSKKKAKCQNLCNINPIDKNSF